MPEALNADQVNQALRDLPGWSWQDDKLSRTFRFGSFKEALSFIVRVGMHAEEANHHPELFNVYSTVTIALCTHDAGDRVTQKDVDLARCISGFAWT